eukprot:CAMPEP_0113304864 /NCGR_PEP_ID=MMETSP0010_2-20120614/4701_1 /TAXON_ID=216773 ORGANISM="Corethron hystrix, Strain 308" /NCGR_SAMPLE_ID=MMETSP0010_2 /ASSEMBLY_ACC=CAM_ASM_000155 /LENGTH=175 /DNA_ID=CAMNT_0000159129 /DNA_START=584 /DNA_END=1111 /DNA_ORIENTATION=- /assembly_acc=CAM_ASM_000155
MVPPKNVAGREPRRSLPADPSMQRGAPPRRTKLDPHQRLEVPPTNRTLRQAVQLPAAVAQTQMSARDEGEGGLHVHADAAPGSRVHHRRPVARLSRRSVLLRVARGAGRGFRRGRTDPVHDRRERHAAGRFFGAERWFLPSLGLARGAVVRTGIAAQTGGGVDAVGGVFGVFAER